MSQEPVQLDLLDWLAAQAPDPAPAVPTREPASPADPGSVLLIRVDPSCNMRRFYSVALATSLFGEVGTVRQWGRIGTEGHLWTDWYDGAGPAEAARREWLIRKQRRGYVPTS